MEIPAIDDSYEEAKRKAKLFYAGIGEVWCPALGDYVVFNSVGFRHLLRKRGKSRLHGEQKRRFSLLCHASDILGDPATHFVKTEKVVVKLVSWKKARVKYSSHGEFWVFREIRGGSKTTLLVRKLGNGKKHFFSIY